MYKDEAWVKAVIGRCNHIGLVILGLDARERLTVEDVIFMADLRSERANLVRFIKVYVD